MPQGVGYQDPRRRKRSRLIQSSLAQAIEAQARRRAGQPSLPTSSNQNFRTRSISVIALPRFCSLAKSFSCFQVMVGANWTVIKTSLRRNSCIRRQLRRLLLWSDV